MLHLPPTSPYPWWILGGDMTNDTFEHADSEIQDVLRRIELLKSSKEISLEEKIKIAELVLSILEEERAQKIIQ